MSTNIIINKTTYNDKIIKKIAGYRAYGGNKSKMVLVLICMFMMVGANSLQNNYNTIGFIAIGFGIIFIPVVLCLIPYFYTLIKLKKELKIIPENRHLLITTFSNTGIKCDNKMGSAYNISIKKIYEISIKKSLVIIQDSDGNNTYLDINGFDVNLEELKIFVKKYYQLEIK